MNRLTQTSVSRFIEIAGEAGMMTTIALASGKVRRAGIHEVSQGGEHYGSTPASFDAGAGDSCLSRFSNGRSAPPRHGATDYGDESLRNRRFRTGSLRLYREQAAPAASNENKNDRKALAVN